MRLTSVVSGILTLSSAILVATGVLAIYYQARVYAPAYIILEPEKHYAQQVSENTMLLNRYFRVVQDVDLTITRELLRVGEEDSTLTRVDLQPTNVHYKKGDFHTQRVVEIPDLPPGPYEVINVVCWQANIARRDCIDLPRLIVDIKRFGSRIPE